MPKITKLYTRQGDEGSTKLSSGQTVAKNDARVKAYGIVDELNSHIGLAMAYGLETTILTYLSQIQNDLFHLGSDLSFLIEEAEPRPIPQVEERHIIRLENQIDSLNAQVRPLDNFVLPGGTKGAAQLHVARAVCRSAEREVTGLAQQEPVNLLVLAYLNRLSDLLFVMARFENHIKDVPELLWNSRA